MLLNSDVKCAKRFPFTDNHLSMHHDDVYSVYYIRCALFKCTEFLIGKCSPISSRISILLIVYEIFTVKINKSGHKKPTEYIHRKKSSFKCQKHRKVPIPRVFKFIRNILIKQSILSVISWRFHKRFRCIWIYAMTTIQFKNESDRV